MKKMLTVLIVMGLLMSGVAYADGMKIASIDAQKLLMDSQAGKDAVGQLDALQKTKKAELERMEDKIKGIQEKLGNKVTMSETAKAELESQMNQLAREHERFVNDAQDELRKKEAILIKPIREDLDGIISDYSKKNGIDLIVDKTAPGIVHVSDTMDVTSQILAIYDKLYNDKKEQPKDTKSAAGKSEAKSKKDSKK